MTTTAYIPDPDGPWGTIAWYAMKFDGYEHFGEQWSDIAVRIRDRFDETSELPDNADDLRAQLFVEFRMDRFVDNAEEWTLAPSEDGALTWVANPDWGPQSPTQVRRRTMVRRLRELANYEPARYRDDPGHPARLNKNGEPSPTRSPRTGNGLYCIVWPEHDLLKLGLSSGGGDARSSSARGALRDYLAHEGAIPGPHTEWRAALPFMEGTTWGDCQRFELVVATALKRRLGASSASALGFEWLTRTHLEAVRWPEELAAASEEALDFSGIRGDVRWEEHAGAGNTEPGSSNHRIHGPAQLDAHRTMRNKRGVCALKGCGAELADNSVTAGGFRYCSASHADDDALSTSTHRQTVKEPESRVDQVDVKEPAESARTATDVRDHLDEIIEDCFWESPVVGGFEGPAGEAGLILEMDGRKFEVSVRDLPDAETN